MRIPPDQTHIPTDEMREQVKTHATVGTPQEVIADIIGIAPKTLRKHYREELDLSTSKANAEVGGALFTKAVAGDTASMIFWMKTRAGWRERQEINMVSEDGSMSPAKQYDFTKLESGELETLQLLLEKAAITI